MPHCTVDSWAEEIVIFLADTDAEALAAAPRLAAFLDREVWAWGRTGALGFSNPAGRVILTQAGRTVGGPV